jgi:hypothetical protein
MELDYIVKKFELDPAARTPIEFPLSRHGGLTKLFNELGYKTGVEVGVEQGKFSEEMCHDNPGVKLYCVDPWQAYSRYKDHVSQDKLDRFYRETTERLAKYDCTLIRKTSMEAVLDFEDNSLDFAYIDGNHDFEFIVNDVIYWSRKVRPGGVVAGHDYRGEDKNQRIPFHVVQAINAYTDAMKIKPWFVLRGDKCATWLYVRG